MITWQDVPGYFDFQGIYDQAIEEAQPGDTLVEVGTWFGRSALYMAEKIKASGKDLRFYVVDKWHRYHENEHLFAPDATGPHAELIRQHGSPFQVFAYFLEQSGLAEYIRVLRMGSEEASSLFPWGRCRMVFIDGDHAFENCLDDLINWHWAIQDGGIFAGHDYGSWPGVTRAVDAFLKEADEEEGAFEVRGNNWFVRWSSDTA